MIANSGNPSGCDAISMGKYKNDVTPLLTQWSYVFLALTRLYLVHIPVGVAARLHCF